MLKGVDTRSKCRSRPWHVAFVTAFSNGMRLDVEDQFYSWVRRIKSYPSSIGILGWTLKAEGDAFLWNAVLFSEVLVVS